ncbi:hypothetical protein TSO352_31120 [Azospirillum sp. TSO35-2]|nr:hypothetical protein TSO352_31120 [Azospirillum sp. TSO35-2]
MALGLALAAVLWMPAPAGAADPGAAPRVALVMDGTSVVVIASRQALYAFVDGSDDNAPIAGAEVTVETGTGTGAMRLQEITPGLYMSGPYTPPSVRTPLTVSVATATATLRGSAELVLPAMPDVPASGGARWLGWLGLVVALGLALLWHRQHAIAAWWRPTTPAT